MTPIQRLLQIKWQQYQQREASGVAKKRNKNYLPKNVKKVDKPHVPVVRDAVMTEVDKQLVVYFETRYLLCLIAKTYHRYALKTKNKAHAQFDHGKHG